MQHQRTAGRSRHSGAGRGAKRRHREQATPAERALIKALRAADERFSFQFVVRTPESFGGYYVVDFLLIRRDLFVELDGRKHFTQTGHWRDRLRTEAILRARPGHRLVRFENAVVLADPAAVVEELVAV